MSELEMVILYRFATG